MYFLKVIKSDQRCKRTFVRVRNNNKFIEQQKRANSNIYILDENVIKLGLSSSYGVRLWSEA